MTSRTSVLTRLRVRQRMACSSDDLPRGRERDVLFFFSHRFHLFCMAPLRVKNWSCYPKWEENRSSNHGHQAVHAGREWKAFQDVTVQVDQSAASALRDKGLSTSDVATLLTEALNEIEDLPAGGEARAVVVADVMLGFEFTATGLIVTKLTG